MNFRSPTFVLPSIGVISMVGAGVVAYGTALFWLWLVAACALPMVIYLAFRGVR